MMIAILKIIHFILYPKALAKRMNIVSIKIIFGNGTNIKKINIRHNLNLLKISSLLIFNG